MALLEIHCKGIGKYYFTGGYFFLRKEVCGIPIMPWSGYYFIPTYEGNFAIVRVYLDIGAYVYLKVLVSDGPNEESVRLNEGRTFETPLDEKECLEKIALAIEEVLEQAVRERIL